MGLLTGRRQRQSVCLLSSFTRTKAGTSKPTRSSLTSPPNRWRNGFIGRVCITSPADAGLLNQRIGRFVLTDEILPRFFFRCLQTSAFRRLVENRCEGSKIRHLYFRHFADFLLPLLSTTQQEGIVVTLDAVDASLADARLAESKLRRLREALIDSCIDRP